MNKILKNVENLENKANLIKNDEKLKEKIVQNIVEKLEMYV